MMAGFFAVSVAGLLLCGAASQPTDAPGKAVAGGAGAQVQAAETRTRDARLDSLCAFVWGKRAPASSFDAALWSVAEVSAASVASEVPFAPKDGRVLVISAKNQAFEYSRPSGAEKVMRSVRGYVDPESRLVLKVLILDEGAKCDRAEILEPLVPSLQQDLRMSGEEWVKPAPAVETSMVDALEGVFRWGLGTTSIGNSSRIVVHAVVATLPGAPGARVERSIWSIDFRDGVVSPKEPPKGIPAITNLRYVLDLRTCQAIKAENKPAPRGALEAAAAADAAALPKLLNPAPSSAPAASPSATPPTPPAGEKPASNPGRDDLLRAARMKATQPPAGVRPYPPKK